jgi:hypothetical protein
MRLTRFWPAFLYAAAAVLAQGLHNHHGAEPATQCEASCADTHTHLSGHSAPDAGHAPSDCLACQFRSEPQCLELSPPSFLGQGVAAIAPNSEVPPSEWPSRSLSCRAPPPRV